MKILLVSALIVLFVWLACTVLVAVFGRYMDQSKPLWSEVTRLFRGL